VPCLKILNIALLEDGRNLKRLKIIKRRCALEEILGIVSSSLHS
jgi:hypothetical protein